MTDYEDFALVAPSGTTLYSSYLSPGSTTPVWSDSVTLPAAGTYTIRIDPEHQGTGQATYAVKAVPADVAGTIVIGGAAVPVTVSAPGQNAGLTFSGTSGQRIILKATSTTMKQFEDFAVLRPNGTTLHSGTVAPGGTATTPVITLDATSSHKISINPEGQGVGTVTYQLSVAPAAAGAARPAAPPASTGSSDPARSGGPRVAAAGDRLTVGPGARTTPGGPGPRTTGVAPRAEPLPVWWQPSSHARPVAFTAGATTVGGTDREATPWAELSPLKAPAGVTAISGQVLTVDGLPLPGVTLGLASVRTTTDAAGRFLLAGLPAGKAVMSVDGATANTASATYGYYDVFVDAVAGRTSVLPWTTWMTPLDLSSTVRLPRRTTKETIVRTAAVPGLELHIPKWAQVVGRDGKPVKEISLTPIPVDRPPFPLPMLGVDVPIYFTLQPGSAVVLPEGAQIHYPNYTHEPPGKQVEFWSYEPDEGWEPYGTGRVTADGTSVLPDLGTRIHEFTGAMFNAGNKPPPSGPKPNTPKDADPVDLATGLFVHQDADLHQPAELPLTVTRTYRPGDPDVRSFGIGSSLEYDMFLWSAHQYTEVDLILPDGGRVHLVRTSSGTGYSDAVFDAPVRNDAWSRAHMAWDTDLFGWRLQRLDGMTFEFVAYKPVQLIRDRFGNEVRLTRDTDKLLTRADSSDGRWMTFVHDTSKRITSVTDNTGRRVSYTYDTAGRLSTVVDPAGRSTTYAYDANGPMSTITNARGLVAVANTYDSAGRVATQTLADGGRFTIGYTTGASGAITATTVTDQVGAVRRVTFDAGGLAVTDTDAYGTTAARTTTYTNGTGGLVTSVADPLGRTTTNAYDAFGLLTSQTTLAGTTRAATTRTTYDSVRHQVTSVTDQLGHVTRYGHLANGALSTLTDPIGGSWRFGTDAKGRILTHDRADRRHLTPHVVARRPRRDDRPARPRDPICGRRRRPDPRHDGCRSARVAQYLIDPVGQVTRMTDPLGGPGELRLRPRRQRRQGDRPTRPCHDVHV